MRDHIKYIDTNTEVEWQPIGKNGLQMKLLSKDHDTGAMTFVLDIPRGWKGGGVAHYHTVVEEVFILSGDVSLDGRNFYTAGQYLYRPPYVVHGHDEQSREGGRAVVKVSGPIDMNYVHGPASPEEYALPEANFDRPLVEYLNPAEQPRETRGEGANRSSRVALSRNPETGAGSYLCEFPPNWRGRAGAHYHTKSEEVFVLEGDIALDDQPIYTSGCYLWRPPGIMHGPKERSTAGCRVLIFQDDGALDFNYAKDMADPQSVPWEEGSGGRMRQALLFGPYDMRVVESPEPEPEPGQVTVQVVRSAPYGTDVELYRARDDRHRGSYPRGLGADFAGIVDRVGEGVVGFRPGDRVVAMSLYHCGECRFCRSGRTNLCTQNPGGNKARQECFQDVAVVWANKLARLPDRMSFDDGAMLSGVMMGMNIFEKLRPEPGETTLVIGAGAMGWPQIQLARHFQTSVIAIGRGARRLKICHDLGAETVIDQSATDDLLAAIGAAAPNGVQCVVETTCSEWGVSLSIDAASAGGRIAWIGGPAIPVNPWALTARELAIYGIKAGHHQHQAIDLVASGRVDLKPSITHRLPLEEVPVAFEMLSGPDRGDVGRIIIEHDR